MILVVAVHAAIALIALRSDYSRRTPTAPSPVMMAYVGVQQANVPPPDPLPPPELAPVRLSIPTPRPLAEIAIPAESHNEIAIPISVDSNANARAVEMTIAEVDKADRAKVISLCERTGFESNTSHKPLKSLSILVRIEVDGRVSAARIESGSGQPRLDQTIQQCIENRALFTPRHFAGAPVPSWGRLTWVGRP